jgi:hypothetical protein
MGWTRRGEGGVGTTPSKTSTPRHTTHQGDSPNSLNTHPVLVFRTHTVSVLCAPTPATLPTSSTNTAKRHISRSLVFTP